MNPLQIFRVALRALARNKMRSFLTTLGMVIGVTAVILTVAVGDGANAKVKESFAAMGSNMLIVMPGTTTSGGAHGGFGSQPTLTWDDLKAIQTEVPSVRYAAPVLRATAQILSEDQNWTTSVYGTTADYLAIRSWAIARGQSITESDIDSGTKVALLGQTVVDKLFGPTADPVGQQIRVKNVPFQVIGVLAKKGQSNFGQDFDDTVIVPYSTFLSKIQGGLKNYLSGTIFIGATSDEATTHAQNEITGLLRDRHKLDVGADDDFSIRNLAEMQAAVADSTKTITTFLAVVAAVSLLVGGIGIMNIMLVSVTERTREIGVRMAVGAKGRDILLQFLVEAASLSVVGGVIGIALGLGLVQIMARFGWPSQFRPVVGAIAVGFSGLIGIGFGLYPARKASLLDPIQALRFE
jgi:putative ABC transport system permease protein